MKKILAGTLITLGALMGGCASVPGTPNDEHLVIRVGDNRFDFSPFHHETGRIHYIETESFEVLGDDKETGYTGLILIKMNESEKAQGLGAITLKQAAWCSGGELLIIEEGLWEHEHLDKAKLLKLDKSGQRMKIGEQSPARVLCEMAKEKIAREESGQKSGQGITRKPTQGLDSKKE